MSKDASAVGIAVVERETGITRETLRIWERRYGSPSPDRGAGGSRLYGTAEISKLRLVKTLIDRGFKPGAVVGETIENLEMLTASLPSREKVEVPDAIAEGLSLIERCMPGHLGRWLRRRLIDVGLRTFVLEIVRPLCRSVGQGWQEGRLRVHQEHVATEQLQAVLRVAIHAVEPEEDGLAILLTTLPGEPHVMGLLMLEALLRLDGANCHSLGAQTPVEDIAACCADASYDVVALSFSAFFPARTAAKGLLEIRKRLPESVEIWAGGTGAKVIPLPRIVPGVKVIDGLEEAAANAARYLRQRAS